MRAILAFETRPHRELKFTDNIVIIVDASGKHLFSSVPFPLDYFFYFSHNKAFDTIN